jgi:hypothetical protein
LHRKISYNFTKCGSFSNGIRNKKKTFEIYEILIIRNVVNTLLMSPIYDFCNLRICDFQGKSVNTSFFLIHISLKCSYSNLRTAFGFTVTWHFVVFHTYRGEKILEAKQCGSGSETLLLSLQTCAFAIYRLGHKGSVQICRMAHLGNLQILDLRTTQNKFACPPLHKSEKLFLYLWPLVTLSPNKFEDLQFANLHTSEICRF